MSQIISGIASVTNGDATVTFAGPVLSPALVLPDSFVILNGVTYFLSSLTNTTTFELNRPYAGATAAGVSCVLNTLTRNENSIVTLNERTAELIADIEILDANTQGLFFNQIATSGEVDPGPGKFSFDSSVVTARTKLYIDELDANRPNRLVAGLIESWAIGTILIVRSLSTTAYAAYELSGNPENVGGFYSIDINYVESDGIIGDEESVSIAWFAIGQGLDISAAGTFSQRSIYNAEPAGFTYLSTNGDGTPNSPSGIYKKLSNTSGDWSDLASIQGDSGYNGWTPRFAVANDGNRRVFQLIDYIGGTGVMPTVGVGQYVSSSGFVSNISSATDIRGPQGIQGAAGIDGTNGATGLSAYQVAVANGFVGSQTAWLATLNGEDGTDPGVWMVYSTTTVDANPGSGIIRLNDVSLPSATFAYISKTNRVGNSIANWLATFASSSSTIKGILTLSKTDVTSQVVFNVVGLTDASGYVKLALSSGSGAASFTNNDLISVQWNPGGNKGTDGTGAGTVIDSGSVVAGRFAVYADSSGTLIDEALISPSDVVLAANNGSEFADKNLTLDNLHVSAANIASAASINLENSTGWCPTITGTTTTTTITLGNGHFRLVRAAAAWPITGSANIIFVNAAGSSYTCTAGDMIMFVGQSGGVVLGIVFPAGGVENLAITNAKLATMAASRIKGRISSTGAPQDLTGAQVTAILNNYVGATSIADGTKGLVSPALISERNYFYRGDGVWAEVKSSVREHIQTYSSTSAVSMINFLDLSAFRALFLIGRYVPSTDAQAPRFVVSETNGSSWRGSNDYTYQYDLGNGATMSSGRGTTTSWPFNGVLVSNGTSGGGGFINAEFWDFNQTRQTFGSTVSIETETSTLNLVKAEFGLRDVQSVASNALSLRMTSGNIASAHLVLEGIRG